MRRRLVCVRGRRVCAFTSVRCIDVSCACAVMYRVRARPSCACVHEGACAPTSRVCVCAPCECCHERACALTSRVRAAYLSQEHTRYGHLVYSRPGMAIPNSQPYRMALCMPA